jgi:hypothetical protein
VEPRANFTQNVMRAIRQAPQSVGFWERVREWIGGLGMPRLAMAGAAALVAVILGIVALQKPVTETTTTVVQQNPTPAVPVSLAQPAIYHVSAAMILAATAETAPAPAPAVDVDDMDPMGLLLVQEDSSALTDSELALLVY